MATVKERLLKHSHPEGDCLIWYGAVDNGGYGQMWAYGRTKKVHHVAWIEHHGGVPIGFDFCHTCDNPACINPDHIWLGTTQENIDDMQAKGRNRQPKGEKHNKAKLTVEQVRAIYASSEDGPTLGRRYGVNRSTINGIKRRATWAHTTGG